MMYDKEIISKTEEYVKEKLGGEGSGHDWWHIYRVLNNARHIQKSEGGDLFTVELAALLHDIADWKFHDGDELVGPKMAREWLESLEVEEETTSHICDIIATLSFKGANVKTPMKTLEGKIVQDSDRLDALGAIGIARTFAYGGHKGREMYNPDVKPELHTSSEAYKKSTAPTLNHFYEKLFLLKDLMNTETAKSLAESRDGFMKEYVERFLKEWDGQI